MSDEAVIPTSPNGDFDPELPAVVSDAEVDSAAQSLGLTTFSAHRARELTKLGAFQCKLGVVHQGVGRLVASMDAMEKIRDLMVNIVENSMDDEVRISAADVANKTMGTLVNAIVKQAEFQTDGLIERPTKNPSNRKFNPTAAIQVNGGTVIVNSPPQPEAQPYTEEQLKESAS